MDERHCAGPLLFIPIIIEVVHFDGPITYMYRVIQHQMEFSVFHDIHKTDEMTCFQNYITDFFKGVCLSLF